MRYESILTLLLALLPTPLAAAQQEPQTAAEPTAAEQTAAERIIAERIIAEQTPAGPTAAELLPAEQTADPRPPARAVEAPSAGPEADGPGASAEPDGRRRVLSIGVSQLLMGVQITDDAPVIQHMWGLDLSVRLIPWLYVGLRRVGVWWASPAAGDRIALGGSPMIGAALPLGDVVELFAELGAALQVRFGEQLEERAGVAPFGGIGARFRLADWLSLGLEGAVHVPVTDTFLVNDAVLPGGSVSLSGGLGVMFHVL
ncbi:MAG: hypothetical protein M5U28_18130 [Sandaracinaceae bacterium]|nr:hypothetical protein [Sandaracinaceae bacterium]